MEPPLLQGYRRDRRKLLEFILSSGLITEIRTPSGLTTSISHIDIDLLSADYVLQCIQSVLDISEATKKYYDESAYPVMIHSQLGDSYFLLSDPKSAGSPPRHVPPRIEVNHASDHASTPSSRVGQRTRDTSVSGDGAVTAATASKPMENITVPSLGLPSLSTGLSDDDLRESAYEILLASMVFCGVEIHSFEDRKKEKGSKFLSSLKSRKDKRHLQYQSPDRHPELIDTIRAQMQISEAMDVCIRQRLMQFASRETCGEIDVLLISLGLLNGISRSKFLNEKSYMQWKKRQANILEELFSSANHITEQQTLGILLAKIRNANEWDIIMSPSERAEVLLAIRQVASVLSSRPGQFGLGSYYWTSVYHLNIRIYEKLLVGVFDILEEGQLIEEADEILKLIRLTWSTLGITQKMHNALFGWVLFQQFVGTDEAALLDLAILEVQKVLSAEGTDGKEQQYMNSLICSTVCNGSEIKPSLVQAILLSMSIWCDSKLKDYHLHFSQKTGLFGRMTTMALAVGNYSFGEHNEIKSTKSDASSEIAARKLRTYVERSIEAACWRVADILDLESKIERTHPLALLANELRLIAERELNVFFPVFRPWYPESSMVSAVLLHQFYGERLKPFLEGVSCLSEDVRLVLPAANMLEHDLTKLYSSACEGNGLHSPCSQPFDLYQIGEVSRPIILDWVIAQSERILEWTGRVIVLEDWEPLSNQQKQAASAVEVFRIIEETVDQFFGLSLPMDITHFQALLSILYHSLDGYLIKLVSQLVEEHHLYPSAPPLTRYKEAVFPMTKKKLIDCVLLEEEVKSKLNELTIPKLCIRLNTLQYIQKQIGTLEDGIRKSWGHATRSENRRLSNEKPLDTSERAELTCSESVDELFVATFDSIRDTAADAIRKICALIGTRVVFWDLRDSFLLHLYHGSFDSARLDSILPHFDIVLNNICSWIDDALRDRVVSSICSASMEGYVWVLLDGGPSCAFSDSDIRMMEDDLNLLKDFFVADGEGLPRSLVEKEATFAHQILDLFSLQTGSVIQMLMTASEHISTELDSRQHGSRCLGDAHTLIRILCHKKDMEASKFLKRQYQLPASSEYDDTSSRDSSSRSPVVTDLLTRSTSFRWAGKSHGSFRLIKKKFQRAASGIRHSTW
ncbi:protein unc-13 homolog isoform X2 [Cornus florida]|uniref:protein unc-13 homolog isoform X2 n=1 Tax=Cornus florida TaxID=4283 RepID=UPI0028A25FA7|nr:protein unc-13 homolog isoform X2 [Cornus florida]